MNDFFEGAVGKNVYSVECYGPDGQLKWSDVIDNLIPNVGLDDILDKMSEFKERCENGERDE